MRRRLILLVFSTTLFALTLLGVILFSFIWALTTPVVQQRTDDTASIAASGLADAVSAGASVTDATLDHYVRDRVVLTARLPDGRELVAGSAPDGDAFVGTASDRGVTVTARVAKAYTIASIRGQALLTIALGVVALGISMLVALFYARRLTRPLEDFAQMAGRIGTGDQRPIGRRYGVPELDAVAEVLDRGVSDFNRLLENERRVTAEASHQLRTPLTALSLRLEEILATDDLEVVRAEATAALGQVERLSGVVDEVVGVSRGSRESAREPIDVDRLVESQVLEWLPAFQAAGRRLLRFGTTGLVAWGLPGAQAQALGTLIENSLVHGQGATTIRVRASGSWVVVEVSDRGPGVPPELDSRVFERSVSGSDSSGLGLALARTLVVADGGRLEMLTARPAVFAMFLPTTPVGDGAEPVPDDPATSSGPDDAPPSAAAASAAGQARGRQALGQSVVARVSSPAASASSGNTQRR